MPGDADEVIERLDSDLPRVRLEAARTLQALGTGEHARAIRTALQREKDAWVRRSLLRSLRHGQPTAPAGTTVDAGGDDGPTSLVDDVWAEATEEMTALLVHEASPLLTAVENAARRELESYEASATQAAVNDFRGFLEVVAQLRLAARAPTVREFNLTDLVMSAIRQEAGDDPRVQVGRSDPVIVEGDPDLVRLAFCNGLRNAIDSIDATQDPGKATIVVNWGITDRDVWISALDSGIGLPEGAARIFDFGTTSKPKSQHRGLGLTIARQAALSLGGRVHLRPRPTGVAFEMGWPLPSGGSQ